ncbi:MAG: ribonucleoside-triphosphate reductase [Candidatus Vogelbacteria bacterium CG10_big_fil_rev_8_21_14_0_10_45_14]|uniref:Ribonucleoside-triphosphate reductase n=1 Tax=Candidatus Vogelbacteria bacterium CG10_big_fil_rev_8_21_14_0_10_45_14 TaxID=1975042 RepID=A0A2H0RKL9_9BACT|nr:MAG: ribonucleoside-triphosphate reductase [Candidatus Vogelbacteria bacterium CG10_big_fil_rev_8_21_14_0_10_45_14]
MTKAQSVRRPALKQLPKEVMKRDGTMSEFSVEPIADAIAKAMKASGEGKPEQDARMVAHSVVKEVAELHKQSPTWTISVEDIQDIVENELILMSFPKTAKAYILYRDKRREVRQQRGMVPDEVRNMVAEGKKHFRNALAEVAYYSFYSKWVPDKGRRETWVETVERFMSFMRENLGKKLEEKEYKEVREYILDMRAMPSMRLLWGSGAAARASNVVAYNCSFTAPKDWQDLGEIMYISMCGTGVGFSVERRNIELLPIIKKQTGKKLPVHVVMDDKEGWADAFVAGLRAWSEGMDIQFDYSKIRPQGARLKTMGGRASGPDPLMSLIEFSREKMLMRQGRHLTTLDVHDIICKIGEIVVAGGVRRSAMISLSELDDIEMREAKNGQFYLAQPQRSMSNNSAVYEERPTMSQFVDEWTNLIKSGSGERGIFNRGGLKSQMPKRRWDIMTQEQLDLTGTNPCGEIILRNKQFCNLSEVVARVEDTEKTLLEKMRVATILGTYQATLTKFPYLSKEWKKNCDEEALLGVSITGQWDCPAVRNEKILRKMRDLAIETNKKYAKRFGINQSASITCVKPSGNSSQTYDSSSGCHPRHAPYYIRRVRIESHNPLFHMLRDMGVPHNPEVGQSAENARQYVLEFPIKAPEGAVCKDDLTALDQLEYWKMIKENFTEHNPSVTVSVGEEEWMEVGAWVYKNWDIVGGLSFLPRADHIYKLAPYEPISKARYEELYAKFPKDIDFSKLMLYEYEDKTQGAKELACVSGVCETDFVQTASIASSSTK